MSSDLISQELQQSIQLLQQGQFSTAEAILKDLRQRFPDEPQVIEVLLACYLYQQKLSELIKEYDAAYSEDNWSNLAKIYVATAFMQVNNFAKAQELLQAVLVCEPNNVAALVNLANAYFTQGHYQAAIKVYENLFQIEQGIVDTIRCYALSLLYVGKVPEAAAALDKALRIEPNNPTVLAAKATLLAHTGKYSEAQQVYSNLVRLTNRHREMVTCLAHVLREQMQHMQAIELYDEVLANSPEHVEALWGKAVSFQELGELNKANQLLQRAVDTGTTKGKVYFAYAQSIDDAESNKLVKTIEYKLNQNDITTRDRSQLLFAKAKLEDKVGQHSKAEKSLYQANQLYRETIEHDVSEIKNYLALAKKHQNSHQYSAKGGVRHLFVVGMPRSGTTLLEQLLGAHPDVRKMGESDAIPSVLTNHDCLTCGVAELTSQTKIQLAGDIKKFYEAQGKQSHENFISCDKLPMNFFYVDKILTTLEDAVVIHSVRHPLSVCLSIFSNYFAASGHNYAYSLAEIADYYLHYVAIMNRWRRHFGDRIVISHYEELVSDPESNARKLFVNAGLNWDKKYLDFWQKKGVIKTLSLSQARKPIYQTSKQKWRAYQQISGDLQKYFKSHELYGELTEADWMAPYLSDI